MDYSRYQYQFPEKSMFRAMEACNPEFDILEENHPELFVDTLQQLRNPRQFHKIEENLGIGNGEVSILPRHKSKYLFSGHRGSGKTCELLRFHDRINKPKSYFSVFISLQEEIEILKLEPEDLYFILIKRLISELKRHDIDFDKDEFEEIAKEWVEDKEVEKELKHAFKNELAAEVEAGFSFWNLFTAKASGKTIYGYDNQTTTKIRKSIQLDPDGLANRLNIALIGAVQAIREKGLGQDIIFIIDDFEKAKRNVYRTVFIEDPQFIRKIDAHLICCVPIQTYYEVQDQSATDFFPTSYLPMVRLEKEGAVENFKKIITTRANEAFFAPFVLDKIVEMSGGSPRQLLQITNQCLQEADEVVTMANAETIFHEMSIERMRRLTKAHHEILEAQDFDSTSPELLDLMFTSYVMEYNGKDIVRKINPLLEKHFPKPKNA
jgi:hypothetical protein